MNITRKSSEELSKQELFKATLSPTIGKMADAEGSTIQVKDWVIYEDNDKKDPEKVNTILSIIDATGQVLATNSKTFIDMFCNIVDIMGTDPFELLVTGGNSKAGRHYLTCDLVM